MDLVSRIEKAYLKSTTPNFRVGDTVEVKVKILEGDKERLQSFVGTVIRRKGRGIRENFTVRRIVEGEGVERVFPLHSPKIGDILVQRKGKVRRARLYYLRDLTGKKGKVKEQIAGGMEKKAAAAEAPPQKPVRRNTPEPAAVVKEA
ncbi:MAG: 50S ribosomal protein L19 [Planctomycetes bacterium]|nr:50S ribosomal protein L19 [Planctomycetota bacterium]